MHFAKRLACSFSVVLAILSILCQDAQASIVEVPSLRSVGDQQRRALVIGNGAYSAVPSLKNPQADANAVADQLRALGYSVLLGLNLDRRDMNDAIGRFLDKIQPGDETLVFYAGHGVELQGSNFLLPTDIPRLEGGQDRFLRSDAINLTDLLGDIQSRGVRVAVVVLDACRDNPFATNSTRSLGSTRGLGRIDPPRGSFVIFSAGVGERALDNLGESDPVTNGVFTRKFLRLLNEPGIELRDMMFRLRNEVSIAAAGAGGHIQVPSYYDQLIGKFYFVPPAESGPDGSLNAAEIGNLTSSLQIQMKRVGCFSGEPSGSWNLASSEAVSEISRIMHVPRPTGTPADDVDGYQKLLVSLGAWEGILCKPSVATSPPPPKPVKPQKKQKSNSPASSRGGKCVTFNGVPICE